MLGFRGAGDAVELWTAAKQFLDNAARYARTVNRRPHDVPEAIDFPVFVINLARSEARREFMDRHLRQRGFRMRVFPAVDARELDIAAAERAGLYDDVLAHERFARSLAPAEIATTLSHLRLHERLIAEGIDAALILEDDAMLADDAWQRLPQVLAALPDDWDVFHLYYTCEDYEVIAEGVVRFRSQKSMPVAAVGYVIRTSGARKMVQHGYPVCYPADSLIGRSPRWGTKVYGALPQLVTHNNVFPSSIHGDRGLKGRIVARAKSLLVKALHLR